MTLSSLHAGIVTLGRRCVNYFGAAMLFMSATSSFAQEEDKPVEDERYENWYQVELIVFERLSSAEQEAWPNNISLHYPKALDHLFTQEEWEAFNTAQREAKEAAANINQRNTLALNGNAPTNTLETQVDTAGEIPEEGSLTNTTEQEINTAYSNSDLAPALEEKRPSLPEMETPRITLDAEERALNSDANRLNRRSAYRVLFHQAWRQELLSTDDSKAIPIYGGELFDQNHQLEGWVKFSLNRFLHFEAQLWRVDYTPNYGQDGQYWPEVPAFPKPEIETTDNLAEPTQDLNLGFGKYLQEESPLFSADSFNIESDIPLSDFDAIKKSPFLVEQVITLSQKRRMRSKELHYIDHPKLGIIVQITPYTVELKEQNDGNLSEAATAN